MTDDAKSIKALKRYYRKDRHLPRDADELIQDLEQETPRSAIVILGSVLEDALQLKLAQLMRPFEDDDEFNRMFEFSGPLGSFSSKIQMAYAMKIIEKPTREQLTVVREMRNACAHSQRPISFKTPQLRNVFMRMFSPQCDPFFSQKLAEDDPRDIFTMECKGISLAITRGSRSAIHTLLQKLQAQADAKK